MEGNAPEVQTTDSSPDQTDSTAAPPTTMPVADPAVRFRGLGTNFRAKLIGVDDVLDSRGDEMCQESILKLKAAVQASGRHKQKVTINVSLEGIKIVDVLTGEVQHVHPVHRISFIARDLTDRRAFGYVYGAGEGRHQFFGIKTAKAAEMLVLALRDLFQVVYDMKKKEIEAAKEETVTNGNLEGQQAPVPVPRQQPVQGNVVYAVPQKTQQEGNLFDLEQQLTTIQEGINNIDAIGPWPQDLPTSPDSNAGDLNNGDLFGMANLSDISSLSSDFSCASNVIIDYGHAGGGQQQFERTGSSRSSVSCQGGEQVLGLSRSSSSRAPGHSRLSSVPDESANSKPGQQKKLEQEEFRQTVTRDTAVINRSTSTSNPVLKPKLDNKHSLDIKHEKNGTLSGADGEFSVISLRKTTSVQSLPGSEKGSKRHGSGFFSRSKKSSKKTKNKKDKGSEKKKYRGDKKQHSRTSSEVVKTEGTKPRSISTTLSDLQRRDSLSSVNSVRSCIVATTVHNTESVRKSSSRTSLNVVASSVSESHGEESKTVSHTADSYIIHSSICPRTRPRPKKHENIVTNSTTESQEDEQSISEKDDVADNSFIHSSDSFAKEADKESCSQSWIASFDTEFEHMSGSKNHETEISDEIDPFTGLATNALKSTLTATFEDESWSMKSSLDNGQNPVALPEPFGPVEDFNADPFSSEAPFDNADPFASSEAEDPFAEALETFEDPFADGKDISNDFFTPSDVHEKKSLAEQEQLQNTPTFPPKSEEIMFTLKESISHSAEESSMTSGMSTPVGTQSPEHAGNDGTSISSNLVSETPTLPPAIPPRLPPRPTKKSPEMQEWDMIECPSVPPPPLPEDLPDTVLANDISYEDCDEEYLSEITPEVELVPPKIPQRVHASFQSSVDHEQSCKGDAQSNSSNAPVEKTTYSDELFDLASPVAQPAPQPGAKLTKEQILSSFGTGATQQPGMFPGQPGMAMPAQQGMMPQGGMQYNAYQQQMQGFPQATAPMGMFPPGPSPAIPPRPGAMRPAASQPLPGGAAQNPFGDSLVGGNSNLLAPVNNDPVHNQESAAQQKSDPFAGLIPGMGAAAASNKKDMFKNFQMAKPPQPPPRTNAPVNPANELSGAPQPTSNFDAYFLNSVGGVPVTEDLANNNPAPVPTKQPAASDPFGMGLGQSSQPAAGDPFGGMNNSQSLFG